MPSVVQHVSDPAGDKMSGKRTLRGRLLSVGGFIVVAALLFAFFPRKSSFPPLPEPNGYDALIRAAARIIRSEKSLKEMTTNELGALISTNRTALVELRRALELPSAVPVKMGEDWIAHDMTNLMTLKEAAWAMRAEVLFRQRQGELAEALDESFDLLRFGKGIYRGGVLIDMLVGTACEGIAVRSITNLLPSLSSEQCKRAASELEQHEAQREPFDEIMSREKEWQSKTFGLAARFYEVIRVHRFSVKKGLEACSFLVQKRSITSAFLKFDTSCSPSPVAPLNWKKDANPSARLNSFPPICERFPLIQPLARRLSFREH